MKKLLLSFILCLAFNQLTMAQTALSGTMQETGSSQLTIGQINKTNLLPSQKNYRRAITSLVQLLDSTKYWSWDTLSNGWNYPLIKEINFIYDAHNNETSSIGQVCLGGTIWLNNFGFIYTYDTHNNKISQLKQKWISGAWVNSQQYISTYDANNNITSELDQDWISGAWVNYTKETFTYDGSNNNTSELYQHWVSGAWINSTQYANTVNINNKITSHLVQGWSSNAWVNYQKSIFTYNTYNNKISQLDQNWSSGSWVDSYQFINTYDNYNNQTSSLIQHWNGSSWINIEQQTHTYDANNFEKSFADKQFNNNETRIMGGDSANYYFHTVTTTDINNLMAGNANILIAPNPFTTQTTILFDKEIKNGNIKIVDMLGKEVKSINFTGKQSIIEKAEMQSGIYFVQITDENRNVVNRKIIVQ